MRQQPDATKEMKKKVKAQEKKHKDGIQAYEKIIKEKQDLIDSYEKVMYDNKDEDRQTKLPSEIIKDLKTDVAELEKEKNELEQKLLEEKRSSRTNLPGKLKK